jgi:GNAT superfamily N-acetyltransferase
MVSTVTDSAPVLRSLVRATEIDVLPLDRVVERREDYFVVRSPSNPQYYWGNLLVFDEPPRRGDAERWESLFALEFARSGRVRHMTFAWDVADGSLGAAREELVPRGLELELLVGLIARARDVRPNQRESRDVLVRALDPAPGTDAQIWEQVVELQVAARDERFAEDAYRAFVTSRLEDLRELFRAGRGASYVALDDSGSEVQGSCGVVVTGARGRFQAVDTAAAHRRKGVCSRLMVEAARAAAADHGAQRLVVCADPDYHALGLYESLGFRPRERVAGACRPPPEDTTASSAQA